MTSAARLLGFAFANADLLFEVDQDTSLTFVSGAASEFLPEADTKLIGQNATCLFAPADGIKFATHARAMGEFGRAGPLPLKLANGHDVTVSLCRLPQNGRNISCTLTRPGIRQGLGHSGVDAQTGLAGKDSFLAAASAMTDGDSALTLVDVPDLPNAIATLPAAQGDKLMQHIGELVQAAGPKGAGRVSDTTFGAVIEAGKPSKLASAISAALKEGGLETPRVTETLVGLTSGGLSEEQRLLAVRHVVTQFAEGKHDAKPGECLAAVFDTMVSETQKRALALTDTVLEGNFSLAYQPIVILESGTLSHHEALARFESPDSTGETISFAEALGISDAFDVAVTAKVLAEVEANCDARLALNLSGATISNPTTLGLITGLLATKRGLAPRVLIEVTETAEVSDVKAGNHAIQSLRAMGYKVGLDDFGAGAASFQYLHAFDVDFVKFDNALIRGLGKNVREDLLVGGLAKLCRELGIYTVAEGVEDEQLFKRVRAMGFDYGQGYHFGRPDKTPSALLHQSAYRAKRKGERVSWG